MKKSCCLLSIWFLFAAVACRKQETPAPVLVVEGWIENGAAPVVMLSESIPVVDNQEISPSDMLERIAKWAKVTVSDGTRTEVLTGMTDPDYFPPYVFTSGRMKGEVGKTYTLTVEYKDYKATATTVIPEPVPIDTVFVRQVKDSLCTVVCAFTDPLPKGNYYKVFSRTEGIDMHYHPSALAFAGDEQLEGYTEIFLYSTQRLMDSIDLPNIRLGDRLWIKLCTMDSKSFAYWSDFEMILSGNAFNMPFARSSLEGNVDGASGYWIGYGVERAKFLDTSSERL
ncbi:MAG: DUF4249 domain-containing protein [Bacteroidales bacterium]|nr:DUF4249 domain-containing protein [Bacteroidales bacterium]